MVSTCAKFALFLWTYLVSWKDIFSLSERNNCSKLIKIQWENGLWNDLKRWHRIYKNKKVLDGRLREKFISIHLLDTAQLGLLLSLYFRCGVQSSLMSGDFFYVFWNCNCFLNFILHGNLDSVKYEQETNVFQKGGLQCMIWLSFIKMCTITFCFKEK